jgi:hypothetical protein
MKEKNSKNKDSWVTARKKYRLSAEQITMAQALGLNPKKFGKLANHHQEPWKAPLGDFIEECYQKRFKGNK